MTTVSKLISNIRKLAEQYPDARYRSEGHCYYTKGKVVNGPDREGCIVGQGSVGLFSSKIKDKHAKGALDLLEEQGLLEETTDKQGDWLEEVQALQDLRWSWSKAVAEADKRIGAVQ